jgi:glutaminyl-tRNA synthetase
MATEISPQDAAYFHSFGLAGDGALKQVAAKASLSVALKDTLLASGLTSGSDARVGNLLFLVASGLPDTRVSRRALLALHIASGKLRTAAQVTAAIDFLKKAPGEGDIDVAAFSKACGLGVIVTDADLAAAASSIIDGAGDALTRDRYAFPIFSLLPAMKEGVLKWGDGKASKDAFDAAVLLKLGPKTAEDDIKIAEAKKLGSGGGGGKGKTNVSSDITPPAAVTTTSTTSKSTTTTTTTTATTESSASTTSPLINPFAARDVDAARNSPLLLAQHAAVVQGKIRTRFPPEPNGFLHIGHAKSMSLNFDLAFKLLNVSADKRDTTFRYDDTNPDAESQEYIDNQAENVAWMGWRQARTTHSSDYFDELFVYAQKLITDGHAYVCHQSKADIEASREAARSKGRATDSPWRNRPVVESLELFDAMRSGRFAEGAATLRLKIDMASLNATLWDPVAYRVKFTPHPHTGDKWCIYPSYDYSHAVIDSIEHIDYSLW